MKEGGVIEDLLLEIVEVLAAIVRPDNLAVLSILATVGYRAFKSLLKKLDAQQDVLIKKLDERLNLLETSSSSNHQSLEREILRLQILNGIDSKRLSYSEVLFFFDKYKALGGNSFVEDRVEMYLHELHTKEENDAR